MLKRERLDLSQVIVETTSSIKAACTQRGVEIAHERSDQPLEVMADPRAIRQILKKILSNAVKFTPADGKIVISSQVLPEGVVLVVSDNGMGIAEADIRKVLVPFEHIKQTYVSPQHGTGLGLAISKSLAEMQGGSLRIESTEGLGTTVFVTIPTDTVRGV